MANKKDVMVKLLDAKSTGIYETNNVLARIWRIILYQYGVTGSMWAKQMDKYQFKQTRKQTRSGKRYTRGNLTRALAEKRMSWSSMLKGLEVLDFDKVEVQFNLTQGGVTRAIKIELTEDVDDDMITEDHQ